MRSERRKSFWGWGFEDRFPDDDARRSTAAMASQLLGVEGLDLERIPRLEDLSLRAPRVQPPPALAEIASTTPYDRASHTYGKSYRDLIRGLRGNFARAPDLVVRPRDDAELEAVLEWCSTEALAVIPYGGGTSVTGGVEADVGDRFRAVVSLDLSERARLLDVDPTSRTARIEAGATGPALEAQLRAHGLTLRHYPQSFEHSTLGGWIATRAGGHFATLYTHIDELVSSVRMISPAGTFATRPLPASGAGPSPERLVLGSEGTLGVITEATVRVQARPRFRARADVVFPSFAEGAKAARAIAQSGLYPSNCRLLDEREVMLHGVGAGGAVLLLAFESADHPLGPWIDRALALARDHGGRGEAQLSDRGAGEATVEATGASRGDAASAEWRAAFLDAPYLQTTLVSVGLLADTFETACPWSRFDALHTDVVASVKAVMRRSGRRGIVSCRFTHVYPDGPAPYYTFVVPAIRGGELEQWQELKAAASEALLRNGATITHHHAVGRMHRPWYDRERPELFGRILEAAKRTLDPAGVLNPGVLIGER